MCTFSRSAGAMPSGKLAGRPVRQPADAAELDPVLGIARARMYPSVEDELVGRHVERTALAMRASFSRTRTAARWVALVDAGAKRHE